VPGTVEAVVVTGPVDAVVSGPPKPTPLHPEIRAANTKSAAVGARL
jgi:hypothetical protein